MAEKIKILHLEDNQYDAELIHALLEGGGIDAEITLVKDKDSYKEQIDIQDYDLVISDYSMPQYDGLKALLEAKKRNKNIPFIFCSGTIGEERAVQCLQLGAMDYVIKDRIDRLIPAITRAMNLVKEIKEKERTEIELAKIRLAVDNTGEAIFMTEADGTIMYVNNAFVELYGWDESEVIGKVTPRILKSGKHDNDFYKNIWQQLNHKKQIVLEVINKAKDGRLIEIKSTINPVLNKNGLLVGYVSIQSDISKKKKQEEELLKAKKEAEEMNKLKSYFMANMSHEMRTPLISILGYSEILSGELKDEEQLQSIKRIHKSGLRLHDTINSMLSLQEIEEGNIKFEKKLFNLNNTLNKLLEDVSKELSEKHVQINYDLGCREIWINTDKGHFERAISKIFDNAVKFTDKGEITVQLKDNTIENKKYILLSISDTGIGIEPDKMQKLFTPFRQVSEGYNRAYEGMGLGLYITKQILDLLECRLNIESSLNVGTTVTVLIPYSIIEIKEQEEKNMQNIDKNTMQHSVISDKPAILLVEDNEGNRKILLRYAKDKFIIDEAASGEDALSMAETKSYDLILMDIHLGAGLDGMETCKKMRTLTGYENTPIIAMTAFGTKENKHKYTNEGFDDYFQKPFSKEELIKLVEHYVHSNKKT